MLRQHPNIWMPPFKEVHFFDHLFIEQNRNWTLSHIKGSIRESLKWHLKKEKIDLTYFKYLVDIALVNPFTEEWYLRCFARKGANGKLIGDITPEYCTIPEEGILYIKKLLGSNLKLIYIIRDPLSRALSQLRMNVSRHNKQKLTEKVWMDFASSYEIKQRGDYKTYIPRWKKHFASNLLLVSYENIKKNPNNCLNNILVHLELYEYNFKKSKEKVHETEKYKVPDKVISFIQRELKEQIEYYQTIHSELK